MDTPTLPDYVTLIYTLFERFEQETTDPKRGRPFTYAEQALIVWFMIMQFHRIFQFKTQQRCLQTHPERCACLGLAAVPHRTTLSRRYKHLYPPVQRFVAFVGQDAADLDPAFSRAQLVGDQSLFKAQGPVWHQRDRAAGRIAANLRHLDPAATWSKSGSHGWVSGSGVPLTCNAAACPKLIQVETGAVSASDVMDQQAEPLLMERAPQTVGAENSYAKASRIRQGAKRGVTLLTPAYRWISGRYASAYHRFITEPTNAVALRKRRTTLEPLFDLLANVLGTTGRQKQLCRQGLDKVRTCLGLATLTVQIAMLVNSRWRLPMRNISMMASACT